MCECGEINYLEEGCNHIKCLGKGCKLHLCTKCGYWNEDENEVYKHMRENN